MVLAFPLSIHPGGTIMSPGVDTNLFMWTLAWDAHALVHQPAALFDANTFFPLTDSLAFSENLLGASVLAAPVLWLGGGTALAMNIVALVSIPLSALGAYYLARQLGVTRAGAVVAGIVFGFAPPRFFRLDQLHLTTIQWIPFCLAFAHAYIKRGRARDLRIAIAFFSAQAVTSGHGGVFLATAIALLSIYAVATGTPLNLARRARDFGLPGLALLVPVGLVLLPYYRVQESIGLRRTLADYRVVGWESFLASPSYVHRWIVDTFAPGAHIIARAGAYLFPGILPLMLAVIAIAPSVMGRPREPSASRGRGAVVALAIGLELLTLAACILAIRVEFSGPVRWRAGELTLLTMRTAGRAWAMAIACTALRVALLRRVPFPGTPRVEIAFSWLRALRDRARDSAVILYGLLTILCVWLSIPPPLGLWEYVYWLPGLDFIRAPSRFMILGTLGLAVLAASGFDRATRGLSDRGRALVAILLGGLMAAEFAAAPLGVTAGPTPIPAIDRWLADQPGRRAIAEAPVMYAVSDRDPQQSQYMLHSMAHWHKTVHGYSGVHPPLTEGLYEHLAHFPDTDSIRALQSVGVDTVVVHMDAYPDSERTAVDRRLSQQTSLHLEHVEGDGRIYSLR